MRTSLLNRQLLLICPLGTSIVTCSSRPPLRTGTLATAARDSDCQWQAEAFAGGSIQPTVHAQCITALTEARIADLKFQLGEGFSVRGSCAASRRYDVAGTQKRAPQ